MYGRGIRHFDTSEANIDFGFMSCHIHLYQPLILISLLKVEIVLEENLVDVLGSYL